MSETWIQVLTILGSNLLIMLTFFGISISLHNALRDDMRRIEDRTDKLYETFTNLLREIKK